MFRKILIANRGEIVLRIIRACKELGIKTVAVYSEADKESLHLKFADETRLIGPPQPMQSYLNIDRIIQTAKESASEAIHPGYGFLAQIPAFVRACEENNMAFIGPSSTVLEKMGNKVVSRKAMKEAGLQVIPGTMDPVESLEAAKEASEKLGYPIIIKAAYGGGGRGMRVINHESELAKGFEMARLEAGVSFGNPQVYIEKQLVNPRHIEFQILADKRGNVIHLGERECSIQRKHQKLVEETPSSMMINELRKTMEEAAIKAAKAVDYTNAGTVEFLVDEEGEFYFLEMNTRLQVEHIITEMVSGVDIVKEQIRIAAGEPLQYKQEDIEIRGHAIDCRINAEDPEKDFAPCPDVVTKYHAPGGPGVRVDSVIYAGYTIPVLYDSLIAKLAVWGRNREEARCRMANALAEYEIEGIKTTIPIHRKIMEDEDFIEGRIHTGFLQERIGSLAIERELRGEHVAALTAALHLSMHRSRPLRALIPKREPKRKSQWRVFGRGNFVSKATWGI